MAVSQTKQFTFSTTIFGIVSFILGVLAKLEKPASGMPIPGNGVVICKFQNDPSIALGSLSILAALISATFGLAAQATTPCAACKFLRRKCRPECVFAPYFPPDNPQKFINVHRVFGASNVSKLLNDVHPYQREDAVNSLAYEADMHIKDPVYGCVRAISILEHQLRQLEMELSRARAELFKYRSSAATANYINMPSSPPAAPTALAGHSMPININQTAAAAAAAAAMGNDFGFQHRLCQSSWEENVIKYNHQMIMTKNYDTDLAARLGANEEFGGAGINGEASMVTTAEVGLFGGVLFMKPSSTGRDKPSVTRTF